MGKILKARYAFCTYCLDEMDRSHGFVWIRSEWTCALVTHCARHCVRLHESCPECFVVDPLSIGPSSLPGRANACRRCDSLLALKNGLGLKDLTGQVLSLQQRLSALRASTGTTPGTPRKQSDGGQWERDVAELLRTINGTPVFLLIADGDPRCDVLLRGRTIPEAELCYVTWHWRLLLAYALAEIPAIPPF